MEPPGDSESTDHIETVNFSLSKDIKERTEAQQGLSTFEEQHPAGNSKMRLGMVTKSDAMDSKTRKQRGGAEHVKP